MQFLYPAYLFGLFLVIIPIIIHLFKLRRYKTVYFSSLKFLKDAKDTYRNKSRLKDIILLIVRILFIVALVFAFAQPYRDTNSSFVKQSSGIVCVYIDASQSMENQSTDLNLLDQAKVSAIEIINRYPLGTSYLIIDEHSHLSYTNILDKSGAIEKVSELQTSFYSETFSNIVNNLANSQNKNSKIGKITSFHVFSDFQVSFFDYGNISSDITIPISFHRIRPTDSDNIYIDTCWLDQPIHHFGSRISISGKIFNRSSQNYKQFPVILKINDSIASRTSVELPSNSSKIFSLSYLPSEKGNQVGELTLNDYPVDFDNSLYFAFGLNNSAKVCHLFNGQANQYISAALQNDSAFLYDEFPITAYPGSDFSNYQTLIISGVNDFSSLSKSNLKSFVSQGGNLIVFPDSTSRVDGINELCTEFNAPQLLSFYKGFEVVKFSKEMDDFHNNISLNPESTLNWPRITSFYSLSRIEANSKILLEGTSKRPILLTTRHESGAFVLSAITLDSESSTLGEHPLFIPLLYYLCTAESRQSVIYSRIGNKDPFSIPVNEKFRKKIELLDPLGDFMTIPQQEAHPDNPIVSIFTSEYAGRPGVLIAKLGTGENVPIAMNHPRKESVLSYVDDSELDLFSKSHGVNVSIFEDKTPGKELKSSSNFDNNKWVNPIRWLVMLALLMLIIETILFRIKS